MCEVPATEFTRKFGLYRDNAQREPIAVTSHGRATGYFVSAAAYEDLQRRRAFGRRIRAVADMTQEGTEQVAAGRMSPEHDDLNSLLDEA